MPNSDNPMNITGQTTMDALGTCLRGGMIWFKIPRQTNKICGLNLKQCRYFGQTRIYNSFLPCLCSSGSHGPPMNVFLALDNTARLIPWNSEPTLLLEKGTGKIII